MPSENQREHDVRNRLKNLLSDLFFVEEEVTGTWATGEKIRADLILKPNDKAIEMGFDVEMIGVEIKDPASKESVKKLYDCILQAYTYTLSEFSGERPSFILIYPMINEFFNYDFIHKYRSDVRFSPDPKLVHSIRMLMQRANVGELEIDNVRGRYSFRFGGGPFFHSDSGRSKIKGIGVKRVIGSKKIRS